MCRLHQRGRFVRSHQGRGCLPRLWRAGFRARLTLFIHGEESVDLRTLRHRLIRQLETLVDLSFFEEGSQVDDD